MEHIITTILESKKTSLNDFQILIIGQGYIGSTLKRYFEKYKVPVVVWERKNIPYDDVTFRFEDAIMNAFPVINKLVIINTAGYVGMPNVDACETNRKATFDGNVLFQNRLLCQIADWSKHVLPNYTKDPIIFENIATGCIYNNPVKSGELLNKFDEENTSNFGLFNTSSFYSKTKHISEEVLFSTFVGLEPRMIFNSVRIRIPFDESDSPRSYINKVMKFEYMDDFYNSKTSLDLLFLFLISDIVTSDGCGVSFYKKTNVVNTKPLTHSEALCVINNVRDEFQYESKDIKFLPSIECLTPRSNCILNTVYMENTIWEAWDKAIYGDDNHKYKTSLTGEDMLEYITEEESLKRNLRNKYHGK